MISKCSLAFICLVIVFTAISSSNTRADAADETIAAPVQIVGEPNTQIPVDDLEIGGTGDDIVPVRLYVSNGDLAMSTVAGLTFEGASSGPSLEFSGTRSNVNAALATLTYGSSSVTQDTLEISLSQPGEIFYEGNGHLYEVVLEYDVTATEALALASSRTKYGADGYLVTISNEEENTFVSDRLANAGWMGAGDADSEGSWEWVTGPETNTTFWTGGLGGSAVPGEYANWGVNQPDNFGPGEDCGQFVSGGTGLWNDLPCNYLLDYYVVEYGAPGDMPEIETATVDINVATEPMMPEAPFATAGIESAVVSFDPPSDNGSEITNYIVTSSPGGITAEGGSSPITVEGLTAGVEYTFRVVAVNEMGESSSSPASNAVIPTEVPAVDIALDFQVGSNIKDGLNVDVSGEGLESESEYTVVVESTPMQIGSGLASSTGTFNATYLLPSNLTPGSHSVTVYGTGSNGDPVSAVAYFRVSNSGKILAVSYSDPIGNEISLDDAQLPTTGANVMFTFMLSLLLICAGIAFVVFSRRRSIAQQL